MWKHLPDRRLFVLDVLTEDILCRRKLKNVIATSDIGCYTLGMSAPLNVGDSVICMGAGISAGMGFEKALRLAGKDNKVFGFVGDSTFFIQE